MYSVATYIWRTYGNIRIFNFFKFLGSENNINSLNHGIKIFKVFKFSGP